MAKRKDYYQILELNKNATDDEIKKAYRRLALRWHPDKNQDRPEEAETHFKLITEAYAVLSNKRQKNIYDNTGGERNLRSDSGLGPTFSSREANRIFHMFFEDRDPFEVVPPGFSAFRNNPPRFGQEPHFDPGFQPRFRRDFPQNLNKPSMPAATATATATAASSIPQRFPTPPVPGKTVFPAASPSTIPSVPRTSPSSDAALKRKMEAERKRRAARYRKVVEKIYRAQKHRGIAEKWLAEDLARARASKAQRNNPPGLSRSAKEAQVPSSLGGRTADRAPSMVADSADWEPDAPNESESAAHTPVHNNTTRFEEGHPPGLRSANIRSAKQRLGHDTNGKERENRKEDEVTCDKDRRHDYGFADQPRAEEANDNDNSADQRHRYRYRCQDNNNEKVDSEAEQEKVNDHVGIDTHPVPRYYRDTNGKEDVRQAHNHNKQDRDKYKRQDNGRTNKDDAINEMSKDKMNTRSKQDADKATEKDNVKKATQKNVKETETEIGMEMEKENERNRKRNRKKRSSPESKEDQKEERADHNHGIQNNIKHCTSNKEHTDNFENASNDDDRKDGEEIKKSGEGESAERSTKRAKVVPTCPRVALNDSLRKRGHHTESSASAGTDGPTRPMWPSEPATYARDTLPQQATSNTSGRSTAEQRRAASNIDRIVDSILKARPEAPKDSKDPKDQKDPEDPKDHPRAHNTKDRLEPTAEPNTKRPLNSPMRLSFKVKPPLAVSILRGCRKPSTVASIVQKLLKRKLITEDNMIEELHNISPSSSRQLKPSGMSVSFL